jgi:hypothetical protein
LCKFSRWHRQSRSFGTPRSDTLRFESLEALRPRLVRARHPRGAVFWRGSGVVGESARDELSRPPRSAWTLKSQ